MNGFLKRAAALSLLCAGVVHATSQFRSPLSLEWGMIHYPLRSIDESWWIDQMDPDCCRDTLWAVNSWAGYYHRAAAKSFFNEKHPNRNTRKKVSLATLFFGKETFRAEEAFVDGILECTEDPLATPINNPFLRFARISPRFDYNESGAVFGLEVARRLGCSQNWVVGGRISIPYKVIEIEQNNTGDKFEEDLSDVIFEQPINTNSDSSTVFLTDFAYRLDFLSCLIRPVMPGIIMGQSLPIVDFSPNNSGGPTLIAGKTSGATPATIAADTNSVPPVFLIKRDDGSVPLLTFLVNPPNTPPAMMGKQVAQLNGPLPADGSGVNNGVYHFNDESVNYRDNLGADRDAQGMLWVVPHVTDDGTTWVDNTSAIRSAIRSVIDTLIESGDRSALSFFCNQGINLLAHERITGIGDIRTEIYGGYNACDAHAYAKFGILFPTGRRQKDPKRVYFQTPGNNRHFEVSGGLCGGWRPRDWFAFDIEGSAHHAIKHKEKKAAAFKGATIINIGPSVDADVSWTYGILRITTTFFHPCNPDLGCAFGYELWGKTKDHVEFVEKTAVDFFGRVEPLDSSLLEANTNSMTHKLRGEVFYRCHFFEIFAGGSQVLAGRHAMQESEVHLGFACYF